tara:strand:- start:3508 stop:3819 length:312 start_codon:yes stop_codon:yes gene_type:complete
MKHAQTDRTFEVEVEVTGWFLAAARKGLFDSDLECILLVTPSAYLQFADFARYDSDGKYHIGQYIIIPQIHSKAGVIEDLTAFSMEPYVVDGDKNYGLRNGII